MTEIIFWMAVVGVTFYANMIFGACVWAATDTPDESKFEWYMSCPPEIAWFAQPLVLTAWPIALWYWALRK